MTANIKRFVLAVLFFVAVFTVSAYAQNSMEAAALQKVNEIRVANGLSELRFDQNLESTSMVRASEITTSFSHTRPDGSDWYTVNPDLMYGENLAEGYNTPEAVVNAWMASPAHRANILRGDFTTCSISVTSMNGKLYWAQEFGLA